MRTISIAVLSATLLLVLGSADASAATSSNSKCQLSTLTSGLGGESTPAALPGEPEAAAIAPFSLLRRAVSAADVLPPLNAGAGEVGSELSSYYPSDIRLLASQPNGDRWYVVPGFLHVEQVPPAACLPRSLRGSRAKLLATQDERRTQLGYCVFEVGGEAHEGSCGLFSQISSSPEAFAAGSAEAPTAGLVPDGVASVRVNYHHGVSATAGVGEDGYLLSVPASVKHEREVLTRRFTLSLRETKAKHLSKKKALKLFVKLLQGVGRIALETSPLSVEWLSASGQAIHTETRSEMLSSTGSESGSPITGLSLAVRSGR